MSLQEIVWIALCTALICIGSYMSIPLTITPVPLVLQNLFVMLTGLILAPRAALIALATYFALGVLGLPVFSGGTAGFGHILGPTGGYIIGFVVAAPLCSLIRGRTARRMFDVVAVIIAICTIYVCGVPWLAIATSITIPQAVLVGLAPFIVFDIIKGAVALGIAQLVRRTPFAPTRLRPIRH